MKKPKQPLLKMNFALPTAGARRAATPQPQAGFDIAALIEQGRLPEAEAMARGMTEREPQQGLGWKLLAAAQLAQNRPALEAAQRAVNLLPRDAAAICNLGNALQESGQLEQAMLRYREALALQPQLAQAWTNLGTALRESGRLQEAVACFQRLLQLNPQSAHAHSQIALCLDAAGQYERALNCYMQALGADPQHLHAMVNMGHTLMRMRKPELAAAAFERALATAPERTEALHGAGAAFSALGKHQHAHTLFARWVSMEPDRALAHLSLGCTLVEIGRLHEGLAHCRKAHQLAPGRTDALVPLIFCLHYLPDTDPAEIRALTQAFGHALGAGIQPDTSWPNSPDPQRRLRVGLVSADFIDHPVTYFLESALQVLTQHHSDIIELVAYHTGNTEDHTTRRLQRHIAHWRACADWSDAKLAQAVRDDQVDILIDLSGLTDGQRLGAFAYKPAPVQATWLGYFGSTGLQTMDYIISDVHATPTDVAPGFSERVLRLPHNRLCFTAPQVNAAVTEPPAAAAGHITFGCFSKLNKVNDEVLRRWAAILEQVPASRLLLKNKQLAHPEIVAGLTDRMRRLGMDTQRVTLEGGADRQTYLESYARVDLMLDTFPYPGGTTTAESLWMGVPVVTLTGRSMLERQGDALMHAAGLADWVAQTGDGYVQKAVAAANNPEMLAALRPQLRSRLQESALMDAQTFTTHLIAAWRTMWVDWCRGR